MIIATKHGLAVKFSEADIRPIGRSGQGVRGIKLDGKDELVGLEKGSDELSLLTITENGFGKRTKLDDYRLIKRGGKGVINIKTKYIYPDARNSDVIGIKVVTTEDEVMFITQKGIIIRVPVSDISEIGRNTSGVRLMKLNDKDKVVALAKVVKED
jgi:DNA gyrase subunit A